MQDKTLNELKQDLKVLYAKMYKAIKDVKEQSEQLILLLNELSQKDENELSKQDLLNLIKQNLNYMRVFNLYKTYQNSARSLQYYVNTFNTNK